MKPNQLSQIPLSRRDFLRMGAAEAAAWTLARVVGPTQAVEAQRSRVVDVRSPKWHQGSRVISSVVKRMVDAGMMELTGQATPEAAWRALFSPSEVVGLKFNRISRNYTGANDALVDALTSGLLSAGLKKENLIVVEALEASSYGGRPQPGWAGEYDFGSGKTRLSNFLVNQLDAVINVPNLKHHPICGFTGALKNISHANDVIMEGPNRFHGNHCDPYIADLNALPVIREKVRLHLLNGLKGIFDRGAYPSADQWFHNGLLLSRDPVALDAVGLRFLEEARAAHGRKPLAQVGLPPKYIATAANRGLGTDDLKRIELAAVTV